MRQNQLTEVILKWTHPFGERPYGLVSKFLVTLNCLRAFKAPICEILLPSVIKHSSKVTRDI